MKPATDSPSRARRPRRTNAQLEVDISEGVVSTLRERGYRGVTFEDVAQRAQVSKHVLYRRYPDRPTMILAALRNALTTQLDDADHEPAPFHTCGSLRDDLIDMFGQALARAESIGADTYRGLIGESDPERLAVIGAIGDDADAELRSKVIGPAVERGELGETHIPESVLLAPLRLLRDAVIFGCSDLSIADITDTIALPAYRAASGLPPR